VMFQTQRIYAGSRNPASLVFRCIATRRIYLNQNLTIRRKHILEEANRRKRDGTLFSVWTLDSKIFVKTSPTGTIFKEDQIRGFHNLTLNYSFQKENSSKVQQIPKTQVKELSGGRSSDDESAIILTSLHTGQTLEEVVTEEHPKPLDEMKPPPPKHR